MLFFSLILLYCSCSHDKDFDGISDKVDKCPEEFAQTTSGCLNVIELGDIHFYIETSASMGGYFQKDAQFKTIISDLTAKMDANIKPIDIWFIAETKEKYSGTVGKFSSYIATTKIATQKSSELHKIIADMVLANDSNDITILVSDCILSFPDTDIKTNREINKTEAPNALKNNIFSTFSSLKKKGIATSIYAFNSKFYGTYYDYQNGKHTIAGKVRPFYIWVLGDKELLVKFNAKLHDISTFIPEQYLHFGLTDEAITSYEVISQIERKGEWMKEKDGIKDIKIKENETVQFAAVINLESLPEYAKSLKYLQETINIEQTGCVVELEIKDKASVDRSKLKSKPQIESFERGTHVIVIKVSSMNLSEAKLRITLPLNYDTWYNGWSTMDDKNISTIDNKTFAFEHLITGVKEAYATKNENYIDFTINLKKN